MFDDRGPLPLNVAITLIEEILDKGFIYAIGNEEFIAPQMTLDWCNSLIETHPKFKEYVEANKFEVNADLCIFCLIEAMSGRWGNPDELLTGLE